MRKFLLKILLFLSPIIAVLFLGLVLPPTPRAAKSLLVANNSKNELLQKTPAPRIIFIGGSNLSFGLNCQKIKDSLRLNPVNTSIHAAIGLKFMMDNARDFIKQGDIVVCVPEYEHFFWDLNRGSEELLRMFFDVDAENIRLFNAQQLFHVVPFIPPYIMSKFKTLEYFNFQESDIYSVNSFNGFGDVNAHWNLPERHNEIVPAKLEGTFNSEVISYLQTYSEEMQKKGARFFVSFPSYQASAFNSSSTEIELIRDKLEQSGLQIIGTPEKYKMADSLMFNTIYHLNKKGLEYRTDLLIGDLKNTLHR